MAFPESQMAAMRWLGWRNQSGEICPQFGVFRQTGTESVTGKLVLQGTKPDTTFGREYWVNGLTRVRDGHLGGCTKDGPMLVKYDTGTPVNGETWGPKPGQWTLSKGYPGFTVLGVVDATNKIMAVRPEEITLLRGKTDSTHSKGVSGTVSVYAGVTGSESDTTWNITAYNRFATVASGKWVWCAWAGTGWDLISAECG